MKKVKIEKATGMVLAHDITRIIPGKFKGVGFKKGHMIRKKDIPEMIKLGKRHIYVLNLSKAELHEDDAALKIARAVTGDNIGWTNPVEGKATIRSKAKGLLKIETKGLLKINRMNDIIISTLKTDTPCEKNQTVAATRIIPLVIAVRKIEKLQQVAQTHYPIIGIKPYVISKVGAVVTGSEIYKGLIQDEFDQYVGRKVKRFGADVIQKIHVPDDSEAIAVAIRKLAATGCELILTTGGLSVDPDDVTRTGIRRSGAKIIAYGSPVLPGAMFLYAVFKDIPILGLPACVYYHPTTIFDIVFPRVLTGEALSKKELAQMGHGGLCMDCEECKFPLCSFGK